MSRSTRLTGRFRPTLDAWQLARHLVETAAHMGSVYGPLLGAIRNRNVPRVCALCDTWFALALKRADNSVGPPMLSLDGSLKEVYCAMQCKALFSKNASYTTSDASRAALDGFFADEAENRITNSRLTGFRQGLVSPLHSGDSAVIYSSIEIVDRTLGDFNKFLDRLPYLFKLTSGATVMKPRALSARYRKVSNRLHFSTRASRIGSLLVGYLGLKARFRTVDYNLLTVVPKNFKTGRTIACEPEGNLALQLAFDGYAKLRLTRKGQDLGNQRRNAEGARLGSIDGSLATIDLKSASNSVVFSLLDLWASYSPNLAKYVNYLYDVRSEGYVTKRGSSSSSKYEMFSSMGNGATFALETLLFWSIGKALGSKKIQVYGDDIVIETALAEPLMRILSFVGFRPNEDKTFVNGSFRESCGGNFLSGIDVTPVYIRQRLNDPLLCHVLNSLLQRRALLPIRAVEYLSSVVASRPDLPLVPPTSASWQGLWTEPDMLLWKGLLRDKRIEGSPDFNQPVVSGFAGMVPVDHVRDIRTYLLWLADHRESACDTVGFDEDPILATLQSACRPVQWSREEVPVCVGYNAEGYAGETWQVAT